MIRITEGVPKAMPGMTSLFIEAPYNPRTVEIIRSESDVHVFNKKTKTWEVPTTNLAALIDSLCEIDDIEIHNYKEPTPKTEKVKVDLTGLKSVPFEHQVTGIEYGLQHNKWLLLDAPGLGKSLQLIGLANQLQKEGKIKHCLVICGINTLKHNWKAEIEKHSDLSCTILGERTTRGGRTVTGSVADRVAHLKRKIDEFFVITNIETIRSDEIVAALESKKAVNQFDMIILDESHVIKSSGTAQARNFLKLKRAKYKICATGTLLLNNVVDCHVPMRWIGEEHSSESTFQHYYIRYGGAFGHDFLGYKNTDVLKEHLSRCSLRRTKDLLNLPEKTVITEYVDLSPAQDAFYRDILKGEIAAVDKVHISTASLLAMFTRLRQATELPSILTSEKIESSKIERAVDLIRQFISNGESVVLFSSFQTPLQAVAERLSPGSFTINTGEQPDAEINRNKEAFQAGKYPVFLGTWQKCGTGLTLNAASNMIFLSTPYTAGAFEQACDRIHRIGTTKPVFIYNLVCKDTVDEKVLEIITNKKFISDYIIDNEISANALSFLKEYVSELANSL